MPSALRLPGLRVRLHRLFGRECLVSSLLDDCSAPSGVLRAPGMVPPRLCACVGVMSQSSPQSAHRYGVAPLSHVEPLMQSSSLKHGTVHRYLSGFSSKRAQYPSVIPSAPHKSSFLLPSGAQSRLLKSVSAGHVVALRPQMVAIVPSIVSTSFFVST